MGSVKYGERMGSVTYGEEWKKKKALAFHFLFHPRDEISVELNEIRRVNRRVPPSRPPRRTRAILNRSPIGSADRSPRESSAAKGKKASGRGRGCLSGCFRGLGAKEETAGCGCGGGGCGGGGSGGGSSKERNGWSLRRRCRTKAEAASGNRGRRGRGCRGGTEREVGCSGCGRRSCGAERWCAAKGEAGGRRRSRRRRSRRRRSRRRRWSCSCSASK